MLLAFLIWEWPTIACTVQNSFPNDFHLLEGCHLPCISLQLLSHLLLETIALPLDKTWGLERWWYSSSKQPKSSPSSQRTRSAVSRSTAGLLPQHNLAWSHKRFKLNSLAQKLRRGIRTCQKPIASPPGLQNPSSPSSRTL